MDFEERLAVGQSFEAELAAMLRLEGYYVFQPAAQDGAPSLIGPATFKLPDMLVCKDGCSFWLEAKNKPRLRTAPATGMALKYWQSYKAVQKQSGIPVFLMFQDGKTIYGNWLEEASKHIHSQPTFQGVPHILFKVPEAFITLAE